MDFLGQTLDVLNTKVMCMECFKVPVMHGGNFFAPIIYSGYRN